MNKPTDFPKQESFPKKVLDSKKSFANHEEKLENIKMQVPNKKIFGNVEIPQPSNEEEKFFVELKEKLETSIQKSKSRDFYPDIDSSTKSSISADNVKKYENQENIKVKTLMNLKKGVLDIGFKHVEIEDNCVIFSINSSITEEESHYMIFDLQLSTRQNDDYIVMRSFYIEDEEKYKFPKLFIPHLLKLLNSINRKINIGGFFFDFPNGYLYYEISQIYYKDSKEIHKICCKLTDEVIMAMSSYSKAISGFIKYMKSIKNVLKENTNCEISYPCHIRSEIEINIKEFVNKSKERYQFLRKRDTNFSWISLHEPRDYEKELKIADRLEKHRNKNLSSLMLFSKYKVPKDRATKLKIPQYNLEENSRYCSLEDTLKRKPEMVKLFQDVILELLDAGFVLNHKTKLINNFITTNDEFIHLNLSYNHQLSDILNEVPSNEEKKSRKSAYLVNITELTKELIRNEYFDFSIMNTDFSKLLMKVEE